jgi:hypothetical protein
MNQDLAEGKERAVRGGVQAGTGGLPWFYGTW